MPPSGKTVFDDLSRLVTDAADVAQGVRREAETALRGGVERALASMNVVTRDEFEAVKQMAVMARDENDRLLARIAALETKLAGQ